MTAIFFGSIGTIVETSEVQRAAFNAAFERHGLKWVWNREVYQSLLTKSGGRHRIESYAKSVGQSVDAAAIHRTKSKIFQDSLREGKLQTRPGVLEIVQMAKENSFKLAFVTTTSRENVDSLLNSVAHSLDRNDFDTIVDVSHVQASKPDPECYFLSMFRLKVTKEQCVAIEDNVDGVRAAKSAGISCVAFPGRNTEDHDYAEADQKTHSLSFEFLDNALSAAVTA